MTESEFLIFLRKAIHRATDRIGHVGNLVCTQTDTKGEPTVRESEMRTALQQQAEADSLPYGLEVPTLYPYQFSGKGERGRRALTDFALLSADTPNAIRNVLIELKEGQAYRVGEIDIDDDYPALTKDLHKIFAEPTAHGACMLHIAQTANVQTIRTLRRKYRAAIRTALRSVPKTIADNPKVLRDHLVDGQFWFLLAILVLHPTDKTEISKDPYLLLGKWQEDENGWLFERDKQFP